MAHEVTRISSKKVFNKPHLISTEGFSEVTEYLASRPDGLMTKEELAVARDIKERRKELSLGEGDVGVIQVSGALTYEETLFSALCGMSSYQGILSQMRQAVEEGYSTVILDVDSGGGEAYGTFETAKELRKLADENNIKLIAYVDGISASAAYGLSVAADEIIANPYAEVGSVGVLTRLVNMSEKEKKEGIATTYVYAGDQKIPFDAEGEWREDFLADIQEKVDKLYSDFVSHVATMRGIEEESVRSTQAKMFDVEAAMSVGFIDKVMERGEFAEYLADIKEGNMPIKLMENGKKEERMSKQNTEDKLEMSTEQFEQLQAQNKALEKQLADLQKSAKDKELKELTDSVSELTFVEDQTELATVLFDLEGNDRKVVLNALEKAQASLESAATEELVVEGEGEEELSGADNDRDLTRKAIQAKLEARNK